MYIYRRATVECESLKGSLCHPVETVSRERGWKNQ